MPRAVPEFLLNYAMNRWQLNFKKNVGPTSDSIRQCMPNSLQGWKQYYYANVRSSDHIDGLGERLYEKITQEVAYEVRYHPDLVNSISEQMCIDYMHQIVIDRTYNGYCKEIGRV